jgi:hypothetical protein
MGVRVDKARQQGAAFGVDDLGALGSRTTNIDDLFSLDDN